MKVLFLVLSIPLVKPPAFTSTISSGVAITALETLGQIAKHNTVKNEIVKVLPNVSFCL